MEHRKTTVSQFLLPDHPRIGFWFTTVVRWDSYDSEDKIVKDIKDFGLKWIMMIKDQQLIFLTPEEYAKLAMTFDRKPKIIAYPYEDVPQELTRSRFWQEK